MHYYKRNLGDYAKKTGRLTMLQHGSYTLLIDSCYDRERFPTLDEAIEWTWASTEAEVEAVKFVLNRFFTLDKDGCYVQDRVLQELLEYHAKADTNKRIAIERETKRREKSTNRGASVNEAPRTENEAPPNQEPRTKNQDKDTPKKILATSSRFEDFWKIWPASPRKVGKSTCEAKWRSQALDPLADQIIASVTHLKASEQWIKGFEPAPLTYINQRRWEDSVANPFLGRKVI